MARLKKPTLFLLFFILLTSVVSAVPLYLDQQGILRNATNGNLINKTLDFNITFYKVSDDSVVYTEAKTLNVVDGVWNYEIGYTVALNPSIFDDNLYFKTKIESEVLSSVNLTSVPYCMDSLNSNDSTNFGGFSTTTYNTTIISYVDSQDTVFNNSLLSYINSQNASMVVYIDARVDPLVTENITLHDLIVSMVNGTDTNDTARVNGLFNSNTTIFGLVNSLVNDTNDTVRVDGLFNSNTTIFDTVSSLVNETDTTIGNCSVDNSCGAIVYVSNASWITSNQYPNETTRMNNIVGNPCSSGDYVSNFSSDGTPVCDTPAGGGDITAVLTPDTYLYNGSASGSISLLFNTSATDLLYAVIGSGNASFNQSKTNELYDPIGSNCTIANSCNTIVYAGNVSWITSNQYPNDTVRVEGLINSNTTIFGLVNSLVNDTDTTIGNCSVSGSCSSNCYVDYMNTGNINTTGNVSASYFGNSSNFYTITDLLAGADTTIGNCSGTNSCDAIVYAGNVSWITSNQYPNETARVDGLFNSNTTINNKIDSMENLSMDEVAANHSGYGYLTSLADTNETLRVEGLLNSNITAFDIINSMVNISMDEVAANHSGYDYLTNITSADDWIVIINGIITDFNESKLSSIYYNATQYAVVAGTINGGTLVDTQHLDGNYDGVTFNFTEASGSPGLDLRINFTNISKFNRGVMRYKTSNLFGVFPIVQLWSYTNNGWEDYPAVAESLSFATITQPVFDDTGHINNSVVQMRIYKAGNGNTQNHYYVDWIAIIKGYGTPSGTEIDPFWQADKSNYYNTTDINNIVNNNVSVIDGNISINRGLIDSLVNDTNDTARVDGLFNSNTTIFDTVSSLVNETDTTIGNCSVAGTCSSVSYVNYANTGNINTTGNISAAYYGNSSDFYTITDLLAGADTTIGNCSVSGSCSSVSYVDYANTGNINTTGNISAAYYGNSSNFYTITDLLAGADTTIGNCSVSGSCSSNCYVDYMNTGNINTTGNVSATYYGNASDFYTITDLLAGADTTIGNCSGVDSCDAIVYAGNISWITSNQIPNETARVNGLFNSNTTTNDKIDSMENLSMDEVAANHTGYGYLTSLADTNETPRVEGLFNSNITIFDTVDSLVNETDTNETPRVEGLLNSNTTIFDTVNSLVNDTDTTIGNCSVAGSCSSNCYVDYMNTGNINTTGNVSAAYYGNASDFYTITDLLAGADTTIGNCSGTNSCDAIVYAGNISWITSNQYPNETARVDGLFNSNTTIFGLVNSLVNDTNDTARVDGLYNSNTTAFDIINSMVNISMDEVALNHSGYGYLTSLADTNETPRVEGLFNSNITIFGRVDGLYDSNITIFDTVDSLLNESDTTIGNCSVSGSCSSNCYVDYMNTGNINTTGNISAAYYGNSSDFYTITDLLAGADTTIGNCSGTNSCDAIVYAGNISWITSNQYPNETARVNGLFNSNTTIFDTVGSLVNDTDTTIGNCTGGGCSDILYSSGFHALNITLGEVLDARIINDLTIGSSKAMNTTGNFNVDNKLNITATDGNLESAGNMSIGGFQILNYNTTHWRLGG